LFERLIVRELSLFTGAGGGVLGSKLLGWETIGYVEWNDYCQRVLKQRIEDGIFDRAPIFGDIRAFLNEGYARSYSGMVDIITAGFPCQPFSVAGKRLAENDERNMWPETRECIRTIRPRFALLENVPGLLSSGYFGTVLGELSEIGYDARWCVLSAADVGAPHKRERLWILAYAERLEWEAWSGRKRVQSEKQKAIRSEFGNICKILPNSDNSRLEGQWEISSRAKSEQYHTCNNSWWETEPELGRVANGVARRVDRLKAIGNGQVPAVVRKAWHVLYQRAANRS
jgi:DNA (cytosine-5)-methyltransferase 1